MSKQKRLDRPDREKIISDIKEVFRNYSLELDDSGQDWIENDGFYYEYARRIYNAGYRPLALFDTELEEAKREEMAHTLAQLRHYLSSHPISDLWDDIEGYCQSLEGELLAPKGE